jgi:protein TonB
MYSLSSPGALRRVPTSLVLVAGLHFVAIWALINGLQVRIGLAPPPTITGSVLDTPAPPPEVFTPKDPTLTTTIVTLDPTPPPIIDPIESDVLSPPVIEALPPQTGVGTAASIPTPAVVLDAAVDPRHPLTQPAYPMAAIRTNEEGALSLAVLVGTDGRVHDAKVARSSGSDRLDQAAVTEAKARWHLRPATRDGRPFEQWLTLRVVFRLENR